MICCNFKIRICVPISEWEEGWEKCTSDDAKQLAILASGFNVCEIDSDVAIWDNDDGNMHIDVRFEPNGDNVPQFAAFIAQVLSCKWQATEGE